MAEPLVLIPGLQSDGTAWIPLLQELGHRFAFSVPSGHQYAEDVGTMAACVLDQSPARFDLVGWSMGGYVAFEILRRAPQRVAGLTLISTTAAPESETTLPLRGEALHSARTLGLRGYQVANLARCLFEPAAVPPGRIESLLRASELLGLEALERQTRAILGRPDSRPDLAACSVPVLIIAGREDAVIPVAHAREMRALRPDAMYHELPSCGHCPPLEQPGRVAAIVGEWLSGRAGPTGAETAAGREA